jgi:cobalamin-dependent methionine synthase I
MGNQLIIIGELVHASIPKTGAVMRELAGLGPQAYSAPSEPLDYIKGLIESQANAGASYIAVNLDAFGEDEPQVAVEMMRRYVKMVREWGKGVPVCVDSSDDEVLIAGLRQWYATEQEVGRPLLNSIKVYTMAKMLGLKKEYEYGFVGMLMSESGKQHSIDELYGLARQIFGEAVGKYGFKPGEIFFDPTVYPLAIDMPMEPGAASYTHKAFETIKKIANDPEMAGVHCTGGISNCSRDLPGRKIGICRAYVAKAMEYGLDCAIADPAHRFGRSDPDPQLLELVDAYAKMDGSPENMTNAMMLMGQFCQQCRKRE